MGIIWGEVKDELVIDVCSFVKESDFPVLTRRNILKVTAGMYDPSGVVQPLILKMKMLLQEVCKAGLGWDEELGETILKRYRRIIEEFREVGQLVIPR